MTLNLARVSTTDFLCVTINEIRYVPLGNDSASSSFVSRRIYALSVVVLTVLLVTSISGNVV